MSAPGSRLLATAVLVAAAIALAPVSHALARVTPRPRPLHGARGLRRARAVAGAFAVIEPLVRWLAAPIGRAPLRWLRAQCRRALREGGDWLGLDADELIALCACSALACGALAFSCRELVGWPALPACAALLGAALPWIAVRQSAKDRRRAIERRLPTAIDLLALCMDAGLDFAGALDLVAGELTRPGEPLGDELQRVRQELATGSTRRAALAAFALRVPSPAVREFAAAVAQADQKGNPLAETLEVQAQMLRMRRSVAAEEAAARASVLLVLPVVVLLLAILLLLLGPFLARGVNIS